MHVTNTCQGQVASEKYVIPHTLPIPPPPRTPPPGPGSSRIPRPQTIAPPDSSTATPKSFHSNSKPAAEWTSDELVDNRKLLLCMLKEQIIENVELKKIVRGYEEQPFVPRASRRPRPSSLEFDNLIAKVQRCREKIEFV